MPHPEYLPPPDFLNCKNYYGTLYSLMFTRSKKKEIMDSDLANRKATIPCLLF
jgi:hypothetical protein